MMLVSIPFEIMKDKNRDKKPSVGIKKGCH